MRILHLIPSLSEGGAERQLSYLAAELATMGHDVHIAYSREGPEKPELKNVSLHRLKSFSNYDPQLIGRLIGLIRYLKPDVVQTWIPQMDILGGMAAKFCKTPFILREPCSGQDSLTAWKKYLRDRIGSRANAVISNSRGGDKYWETIMPDGRHCFISNSLPIKEIDAIESAIPAGIKNPAAPIVLCAGRLVDQKRPALFLEAVASVRRKKDVSAVLCGDGPLLKEMRRLSHDLGLDDRVTFTGYLPAASIWALMKKASVLVSLSAYEGCPNAVMEAMACSCPLVLSDIQAHREILDADSALFVDNPLNAQTTAEAILRVLGSADDAKIRAKAARSKSEVWSIAQMAVDYEKVYKKCL